MNRGCTRRPHPMATVVIRTATLAEANASWDTLDGIP